MFGNKKNVLPPRPSIPDPEHILEDLEHAAVDDVAFGMFNTDEASTENTNNTDDIYKNVRTFLNTKRRLKQLLSTLTKEEEQLQADNEEIQRLADDIRKQAQAALVIH